MSRKLEVVVAVLPVGHFDQREDELADRGAVRNIEHLTRRGLARFLCSRGTGRLHARSARSDRWESLVPEAPEATAQVFDWLDRLRISSRVASPLALPEVPTSADVDLRSWQNSAHTCRVPRKRSRIRSSVFSRAGDDWAARIFSAVYDAIEVSVVALLRPGRAVLVELARTTRALDKSLDQASSNCNFCSVNHLPVTAAWAIP